MAKCNLTCAVTVRFMELPEPAVRFFGQLLAVGAVT